MQMQGLQQSWQDAPRSVSRMHIFFLELTPEISGKAGLKSLRLNSLVQLVYEKAAGEKAWGGGKDQGSPFLAKELMGTGGLWSERERGS